MQKRQQGTINSVTSSDQAAKTPTLRTTLQQHAGLILSAFLIILCAFRILLFSNGDLHLALAMLNVGNQFTILTSTLFTSLPTAALLAYGYPRSNKYLSFLNPDNSVKGAVAQGVCIALCAPLVFFVLPVVFLGLALAIGLVFVAFAITQLIRLRRGREPKPAPALARKVFLFLVTAAVVVQMAVLVSTPWVPSEQIAVKDGGNSKTIYGYVVGQQGKQSVILNMKRTDLTWVREDDLGKRVLCNEPGGFNDWYWKSLLAVFDTSRTPQREDCKEQTRYP